MRTVNMKTAGSPRRRLFSGLALALIVSAAIGGGAASGAEEKSTPAFYPPSPNPPRIQHLATLSGERDMSVEEKGGFAAFILGDEPGSSQHLAQPYGMALDQGRLYVADTGAEALAIFDLGKKTFTLLHGSGNGRMKRPINVRIDSDGTRYVTDTGRDQVLVFDRDDRFVTAFGAPGQFRPVDVAIAGDRLYVTDLHHHQVQVLDKTSGKILFKFGKAGSADGELFHPTNIALAPEGDLYVVDTGNYRVQRFTLDGKHVKTLGSVGSTPGSFARPKGIAVDRSGRMYVGDAAFENVQVFDGNGNLLLDFGQPAAGNEGLSLPAGVSIDYRNVDAFSRLAQPGFKVEYLILVSSQFGPNKVDVFGFGKMEGMEYPAEVIQSAMLVN
jgi:DNA-binding beta-propeller fold protein YncE